MGKRTWKNGFFVAALCAGALLLGACGGEKKEDGDFHLEGSCEEILNQLYANTNFSDEARERVDGYVTNTLTAEDAAYILGTEEVSFTDAVVSEPLINVDPYQCVIMRVDSDKIDDAKMELADKANPRKWVCVEAEKVMIESNGDVILFVMSDEDMAAALRDAFLALK